MAPPPSLAGFTAHQAWGPGVTAGYDLWFPAIAAEAAARCGSDQLRSDLYQLLAPYGGTQVGCGAWVAYCGAVDYYLGLLAAAQADHTTAAAHLDAATAQHRRLGAPRWTDLSRQQQDRQQHRPNGTRSFPPGWRGLGGSLRRHPGPRAPRQRDA